MGYQDHFPRKLILIQTKSIREKSSYIVYDMRKKQDYDPYVRFGFLVFYSTSI